MNVAQLNNAPSGINQFCDVYRNISCKLQSLATTEFKKNNLASVSSGNPIIKQIYLAKLRQIVSPSPNRVFPADRNSMLARLSCKHLINDENQIQDYKDDKMLEKQRVPVNCTSAPCSPFLTMTTKRLSCVSDQYPLPSSPKSVFTTRSSRRSNLLPNTPFTGADENDIHQSTWSCNSSGSQYFMVTTSPHENAGGLFFAGNCNNYSSTTPPYQEPREITVTRFDDQPFGMKIGRIGDGYYITHIVHQSAACQSGLKVGDEILKINSVSVDRLVTDEVLQLIRESKPYMNLAYKPRAIISRVREVALQKENGVLGIRLQKRSEGLFIDYVKPCSPASFAGLKGGDQVLKVNSNFLSDWSQADAMTLLKSLPSDIKLIFCIRETLPLAHVTGGSQPFATKLTPGYSISEPASPNYFNKQLNFLGRRPLNSSNQWQFDSFRRTRLLANCPFNNAVEEEPQIQQQNQQQSTPNSQLPELPPHRYSSDLQSNQSDMDDSQHHQFTHASSNHSEGQQLLLSQTTGSAPSAMNHDFDSSDYQSDRFSECSKLPYDDQLSVELASSQEDCSHWLNRVKLSHV